tara:strand:+ start:5867 stop:7048 length:1182 start_codon:yes stop_codon:yes gene_type:complete
MVSIRDFVDMALNLGIESYAGDGTYHRDDVYDYAADFFEYYSDDGRFYTWDDIRTSIVAVFDNSDDYHSNFIMFIDRVYRLFRNESIFTQSIPYQYMRRNRWEAPIVPKLSNTFEINPFKYLVGLEIEVADNGVSNHAIPSEFTDKGITKWDCVHDGSLDCGSEFRLRQISNGDSLLTEISNFCRKMKHKGYGVDNTCGVHMHIDFKKSNLALLKKLILFYSRYEKYIYDIVGAERAERRYSQPLRYNYGYGEGNSPHRFRFTPLTNAMGAENLKEFKQKYYQCSDYEEVEHYKYYDGRYSGFNVHSVFLNGTVELRYLGGTLNERYITAWVLFNLSIVDMFNYAASDERYGAFSLNSNTAPRRKEFLEWLTPFGKSQYRKLQRSFLYEGRKK